MLPFLNSFFSLSENFVMVENLSYEFEKKIVYFFTILENIISPVRIQNIFFSLKTRSCIDYFGRKFYVSVIFR